MFTGRDALSTVEQAISKARNDERGLDAALRSATEEAAHHKSEEAEGFRTLARVRLDELVREKVIGDLDAAERQALTMLENHKRQMEELADARDQCQAALDRAEERKHDRDQEVADALEDLDELEDKTAERLKGDARWHEAKEAVDDAQEIAVNADEKADLAETDLGVKGKPYVNDPLFIYLWTKKHAQAEDRSGAFVRFFDRKVARLIGYSGARANYAMLREIPARLREHAKNKQADLDEAKRKLAVVERDALVAAGVEPLEDRVEAAHAAMKVAEDEVVKITAELKRIDDERAKLDDADENEGRAVDLLASALAREDLNELLNEASRTPTKADDQAITSIASARASREKADAEIRQIRGDIREMAKRRTELEEARDRARSVGYDDPRGRFDGQDIILQVVAGILAGALRGYALDRVLRDTFRPGRRRGDHDFGRWGEMGPGGLPGPWGGLPPTLPGPWGGMPGGWGGGGGGGGKGGGWKTGGRMGGGGGRGGWKTGGRF